MDKEHIIREIQRTAGFLEVLQPHAGKGSKGRAQEFRPLEKATRLEIPRLQKNQA